MSITMAGFGTRFKAAGYALPKYRIEVMGRPLFDWSMLSLASFRKAGWQFSFAVRKADDAVPFIRRRCEILGLSPGSIIELDQPTDGQATTARFLAEQADPDQQFAVYNIDTFVTPHAMSVAAVSSDWAGWIPCFKGDGAAWSFVQLDKNGSVVEIREKERISEHATLGLYWFRSARLYLQTYERSFSIGGTQQERYIAPMYNIIARSGQIIGMSIIDNKDVGPLGTPDQVDCFAINPPLSARRLATLSESDIRRV
jgi:NDP-sugar pyrophosphorylase family protein